MKKIMIINGVNFASTDTALLKMESITSIVIYRFLNIQLKKTHKILVKILKARTRNENL